MYWTTREGKNVKISEMETSHIQNCMKMILRKFPAMFIAEDMVDEFDAIPPSYVRCVYNYMKEELNKRRLKNERN